MGLDQRDRLLQAAHDGGVDHGEVDGVGEDPVPDDEINEGVGQPVDLLHPLGVEAGIAVRELMIKEEGLTDTDYLL